jgi:hypothetical protein
VIRKRTTVDEHSAELINSSLAYNISKKWQNQINWINLDVISIEMTLFKLKILWPTILKDIETHYSAFLQRLCRWAYTYTGI